MITTRSLKIAAGMALLGCLAFAAPALAAFGLEWDVPDQGAVTELGILESFHSYLTNTGDQTDTYTLTIVRNIDPNWTASICVGATCYPPFVDTATVTLGAGETEEVLVDVTPLMAAGYGTCTLTISSQGNPALRPARDFTVVTPGLDLLLVVDETTSGLADYYTAAADGTGKSYGVWRQTEMGALSDLELMAFPIVVWSAGNLEAALDTDDMTALGSYVAGGGNLFLSGRDLAYESCDPGSPYYSAQSEAWFGDVLGAGYTGAVASNYASAQGVSGDPITSGMSFGLAGGDGANNTAATLDGVAPTGSGSASLQYFAAEAGDYAAIRSLHGEGMTYFCGFAFEAIDNAADRADLMQGIFDWFDGLLIPAGEIVRPLLAGPAYAAPNPFNPQTSIKFEVGGERSVPAEVVIHDLRGQVVRRLFAGSVAPGLQNFVWNGRTDSGRAAAKGVYLARVKLNGNDAASIKMTLVK